MISVNINKIIGVKMTDISASKKPCVLILDYGAFEGFIERHVLPHFPEACVELIKTDKLRNRDLANQVSRARTGRDFDITDSETVGAINIASKDGDGLVIEMALNTQWFHAHTARAAVQRFYELDDAGYEVKMIMGDPLILQDLFFENQAGQLDFGGEVCIMEDPFTEKGGAAFRDIYKKEGVTIVRLQGNESENYDKFEAELINKIRNAGVPKLPSPRKSDEFARNVS